MKEVQHPLLGSIEYESPEKHTLLLKNIKDNLPVLEKILERANDHWGEEDLVYRFYHESFKVERAQNSVRGMYEILEKISPNEGKKISDPYYNRIVKNGLEARWDNKNWAKSCRPMIEAYFHSKYFLEMAVKYGKQYKKPPMMLHSGWAALLELYGIRYDAPKVFKVKAKIVKIMGR
jgi:hypothetical protein